eukprot:scaffold3691_cov394-Prasinococcus_capsulatus_cf.AAC.12
MERPIRMEDCNRVHKLFTSYQLQRATGNRLPKAVCTLPGSELEFEEAPGTLGPSRHVNTELRCSFSLSWRSLWTSRAKASSSSFRAFAASALLESSNRLCRLASSASFICCCLRVGSVQRFQGLPLEVCAVEQTGLPLTEGQLTVLAVRSTCLCHADERGDPLLPSHGPARTQSGAQLLAPSPARAHALVCPARPPPRSSSRRLHAPGPACHGQGRMPCAARAPARRGPGRVRASPGGAQGNVARPVRGLVFPRSSTAPIDAAPRSARAV